jgi:type IV secretory pathway VirJ component
MRARVFIRGSVLLVVCLSAGCVHRIPPFDPTAPVRLSIDLPFDNHVMELHLSRPCVVDPLHPLVLFATGDGGWRGKDKDAFAHLTEWGYPVAGFSAPSYLTHITRHTHATTPADVAHDYARIIAAAKARLGLAPETQTILLGVSRGSGLAVAAAGEADLLPPLAGVVAVALTREEEYVQRPKRRRNAPRADPEMVMLDNYEYLPRLRDVPLSIIQSTHDDYLPAEEARRLLGPNTATRQLHPIASRNHSFSDARTPLYSQMQASLYWVAQLATGGRTP